MPIEEGLAGVSPAYIAAFNGQMRCAASGDREEQEHKAMVETAHQLYERTQPERRTTSDHDGKDTHEDDAHEFPSSK
jgi:hypothetical protein